MKPFGTIDDFYTVQEDIHEYQSPYNYIIATGDIFLPAAGGAFIGYLTAKLGYNPLINTILDKTMISRILENIKNDKFKNFGKRK